MIARSLLHYKGQTPSSVIFASGVSNSQCTDSKEFERERILLCQSLYRADPSVPFLYLGTCSVYDPASAGSPYVKHKLSMEKLVLNYPSGIVARLPQLIGNLVRPNGTLVASFVNKIRLGEEIQVWLNASRNFLDVDDVTLMINTLLFSKSKVPRIINVANPISSSIPELVEIIEVVLNKKARQVLVCKGSSYSIESTVLLQLADQLDIAFGSEYLSNVIKKYFSKANSE